MTSANSSAMLSAVTAVRVPVHQQRLVAEGVQQRLLCAVETFERRIGKRLTDSQHRHRLSGHHQVVGQRDVFKQPAGANLVSECQHVGAHDIARGAIPSRKVTGDSSDRRLPVEAVQMSAPMALTTVADRQPSSSTTSFPTETIDPVDGPQYKIAVEGVDQTLQTDRSLRYGLGPPTHRSTLIPEPFTRHLTAGRCQLRRLLLEHSQRCRCFRRSARRHPERQEACQPS